MFYNYMLYHHTLEIKPVLCSLILLLTPVTCDFISIDNGFISHITHVFNMIIPSLCCQSLLMIINYTLVYVITKVTNSSRE